MRVFYIGFYDVLEKKDHLRAVPLPGRNKMDYVIKIIEKLCDQLTIVSPCSAKFGYCSSENIILSEKTNLILFKSFGNRSILVRGINRLLISLQLFIYLMRQVKHDDVIISYHSLATMEVVYLIHKLKRTKVIYEFEEVYADVVKKQTLKKKELRIAKSMDAFLFPTIMLNEIVNLDNKPYILIHGSYQFEPRRDIQRSKDTIDCVFAGNLESRKGALEAVQAAQFLPSNYRMKIIGFGSVAEINKIKEEAYKVSAFSACTVDFDGLKSGEDYIQYLQACDIGLCTQDPDAAFTSTSFPSKILSYLSNGLHVVSIRIPAIEGSAVAPFLSFYDCQTPEEIANAILSVDLHEKKGVQILNQLSDNFYKEMREMISML